MTSSRIIYLDNQATTPCDPRVVEAMQPAWSECFANPASSQHAPGRAASARVETARKQVAALVGARPDEVVFTSGATESNNLALKGVLEHAAARGRHVVTSRIEHRAVLDACESLERRGVDVTYLEVDESGIVDPAEVCAALRDDTTLVSLMFANNEIGTLNPVSAIGRICRERGVLFHCDAVQALPYVACDVNELGIDLLSMSAHKMYGPKGIGALYVRRRRPRVRLAPLIDGGGHERGLRSGTLNVPAIIGFGAACELVASERERDAARIGALRDDLLDRLLVAFPDAVVNGSRSERLPNNINLSVPGLVASRALERLETVAISSGAACSSAAAGDGSYVIKCLGQHEGAGASARRVAQDRANASLRLSPGRFTRAGDIADAASELVRAIENAMRCASEGGAAAADACEAPA